MNRSKEKGKGITEKINKGEGSRDTSLRRKKRNDK